VDPHGGVDRVLRLCQLYPCSDAVIILNAQTLALVRVLAFWEAFPGTIDEGNVISCVSVDSGMKLVRLIILAFSIANLTFSFIGGRRSEIETCCLVTFRYQAGCVAIALYLGTSRVL
jgi:hypothetical protein